jgi:hypothetical protein
MANRTAANPGQVSEIDSPRIFPGSTGVENQEPLGGRFQPRPTRSQAEELAESIKHPTTDDERRSAA